MIKRLGAGEPLAPAWLLPVGSIVENRHGIWRVGRQGMLMGMPSHIAQGNRKEWKAEL